MKKIAILLTLIPLLAIAQVEVVPLQEGGMQTNEPSIAIDPKYPGFQAIGTNTSNFMVSMDGGYTWTKKEVSPKEGFYGDPVLYITNQGDIYMVHLSKNPKLSHPEMFDRIVFEKSTQQGDSFKSLGIGLNFDKTTNARKMQDKPWLAVDENAKSKFKNRIYVAWTEFDKYESANPHDSSRIRFAYSERGDSFSAAITVSDTSGDAMDDDKTAEGATMAVAPDGTLFMFWARNGKIYMDQSADGGKTWGKDRIVASQKGGWNHNGISGVPRANSMPFALCDKKGVIHVVFADTRNKDLDVFLITSKDKGATWMPPVRVNNDPVGNGAEQYMPHMCCDRKTGEVFVAYYDRRNSESGRYCDVYLTSIAKGKPKKHIRITPKSFCLPGSAMENFFGDYIGVAAERGNIRVAFNEFDHNNLIVTVNVALLKNKDLSKKPITDSYLKALYVKDSAVVLLHFEAPPTKSASIEIFNAGRSVYKQLLEDYAGKPMEFAIPRRRIGAGLYDIKVSVGAYKFEEKLYIPR